MKEKILIEFNKLFPEGEKKTLEDIKENDDLRLFFVNWFMQRMFGVWKE